MRPFDAKRVEEPQHRFGEIAERVLAVDALGRAAEAGHVGHDQAKALRERGNVADEIRQTARSGAAAVQHEERRTLADLGDKDVATRRANGSALLRFNNRIHEAFLPCVKRPSPSHANINDITVI